MASTQNGKAVNLIAGEDLRGDFAEVLTINASGQVVKTAAATDVIVGILAEDPDANRVTTGDVVPVALIGGGGVLKVKASAAITAGNLIVASATAGKVAGVANIGALAADQMAIGFALEAAGALDDIIEVLVMTVAAPHSV